MRHSHSPTRDWLVIPSRTGGYTHTKRDAWRIQPYSTCYSCADNMWAACGWGRGQVGDGQTTPALSEPLLIGAEGDPRSAGPGPLAACNT